MEQSWKEKSISMTSQVAIVSHCTAFFITNHENFNVALLKMHLFISQMLMSLNTTGNYNKILISNA